MLACDAPPPSPSEPESEASPSESVSVEAPPPPPKGDSASESEDEEPRFDSSSGKRGVRISQNVKDTKKVAVRNSPSKTLRRWLVDAKKRRSRFNFSAPK